MYIIFYTIYYLRNALRSPDGGDKGNKILFNGEKKPRVEDRVSRRRRRRRLINTGAIVVIGMVLVKTIMIL